MTTSNASYCFCTLALGRNYCNLALTLAQDLAQYAPSIQIVILTDRPQAFQHCPNVLAFEHHQQTLGCYHDKQFVLRRSIGLFEACIFVDADMRILAPIPADLVWQPGITAKIVWANIAKHCQNESEIRLLRQISQKLGLKLEHISFVHECLFVVARDQGRELEFLDQWAKISTYLELWGLCRGEGNTIGLAAAKVGLTIRRDELEPICFFKDKLAPSAASPINPEQRAQLLAHQKALEYPARSLWVRVIGKLRKVINYQIRLIGLRIAALKNIEFYYR